LCPSSIQHLMNGSATIPHEVTKWWSEKDGSLFGFFRGVHRLDKPPL